MNFEKNDENYIYEIISKNIKKYRKLKGLTQEQLAEKIDYSLSFIRGIESNYHQTFSFVAIWRIAQALEIDFDKLCIENDESTKKNSGIDYKCYKCGEEIKLPNEIIDLYLKLYKVADNKNLPRFDCTKCDGKFEIKNPMDI